VVVGAQQRLGIAEKKWIFCLSYKRGWKLFRTNHVTTHRDDDSFLVYLRAFAVSTFKCSGFVIQQVRIYATLVGLKDASWCYLDIICE
jgi:hypothetical protein